MPPFVFKAPSAYDYPASRDAKGVPLGTVQPGDVRDLDEALDRWWVPVEGGNAGAGDSGDGESTGTESTAGDSGTSEGDAPESASAPEASGPQPAPPAVIANP